MIIDHIEIKRDKSFEQVYGQYVIQPPHKRTDLLDTVKVLLDFLDNSTISDLKVKCFVKMKDELIY